MAKKRLQKTVRQQLEQQQQRQQQALQIMATHTPQMKRETTTISTEIVCLCCAWTSSSCIRFWLFVALFLVSSENC